MEAPKKKIVAKVTANIYDPNASTSPNFMTANVVRAKVSSSSVARASSVVNGGHSRNNSVTRTATRSSTIQLEDLKGISLPITHSSAPPSSIGRSSGLAISSNSLLMSPDTSPSPVSPSSRQQPRITARQPRRMNTTQSPLDVKFKAHQSYESPTISPFTSPRSLAFSALSAASPASQSPATSPPSVRPRLTSSIRIQQPKVAALKANGGQSTPTGLGHRPRTPSVSSTPPTGAKPRGITAAKTIPSQILTPPRLEIPQSPPGSTLSSRSAASMASSSLASSISSHSHLDVPTAPNGESDGEHGDSFEFDRASTPQNGPDEDDIFAEEARANRKILDLEISNQSLLTVNAMLEATKLRQGQEIRELRRKLREVRHLPQKSLYANPETLSPTRSDLSLPNRNSSPSGSDKEEEEEEPGPDPAYDRIQKLVEGLLSQAHRALERSVDDCMPARPANAVKVLNLVEMKQYERRVQGLDPLEAEEKHTAGEEGEKKGEDADLSIDGVDTDLHMIEDDLGYIASGEESRRRRQPLITLA
ncbi:hypothetical protein FRC14_003214 [Serendipita sp. 396]|nr:hypothetical protein FRC14_003214 [Serendipita sp. 396]